MSYDFVELEQGTTNIGGMGAAKAGMIAELFGRWAPNIDAAMTTQQAGALQVAIWEIVREVPENPFDVFAGNVFFATPETTLGTLALAQSYVQSLTGTGPRASGLFALNNGPMGDPSTTAGTQDVLVQRRPSPGVQIVPEPGSMALLATAILGVAAAMRRRRRVPGAKPAVD